MENSQFELLQACYEAHLLCILFRLLLLLLGLWVVLFFNLRISTSLGREESVILDFECCTCFLI